MSRREPLHALTGLRGVAALWVVVFHLRPWLGWTGALDAFAAAGYLAVDMFFVLSGFVLAYQYGELPLDLRACRTFWWRRLARIAPLHLAITAGLVAVVTARGWWEQPTYAPSSLLAHLSLTQVWSGTAANAWNEPAWSISAEWHAYLAFPLLAAASRRLDRVWLLLVIVIALAIGRAAIDLDATAGLAMFARLFGAFGAGVLLARARGLGWRAPVGTSELAAIALGVTASIGPSNWVPACGAALVVALADGRRGLASGLATRSMVWLGEISFAIYLVHGAALLLLWKVAPPTGEAQLGWVALYLVTVMVLSVAAHRWIERLTREWLLSRSGPPPANSSSRCLSKSTISSV